jgi:hypothetical protein
MGTVVASHNRFGQYLRAHVVPTNPASTRQSHVRDIMKMLIARWNHTLTATQRAQWAVYAAAVKVRDRLGDQIYLTAVNHYLRSNLPRSQFGSAVVDDGPAVLTLPETDPSMYFTAAEATQLATVYFNNALDWAGETGGYLFTYCGLPMAANRHFFKGPWRACFPINGATGAPPVSPKTGTWLWSIQTGQALWLYGRVSRADGRLSETFTFRAIST